MVRARLLVAWRQQPADLSASAEDVEQIASRPYALHAFGSRLVAEIRAVREEPGEAGKAFGGFPVVDEVRHVERRAVAARLIGPDPEHPLDARDTAAGGAGRRSTTLKIAVVAPTAIATVTIAPIVKAGVLRRALRL